jgi:hypothetical protein
MGHYLSTLPIVVVTVIVWQLDWQLHTYPISAYHHWCCEFESCNIAQYNGSWLINWLMLSISDQYFSFINDCKWVCKWCCRMGFMMFQWYQITPLPYSVLFPFRYMPFKSARWQLSYHQPPLNICAQCPLHFGSFG